MSLPAVEDQSKKPAKILKESLKKAYKILKAQVLTDEQCLALKDAIEEENHQKLKALIAAERWNTLVNKIIQNGPPEVINKTWKILMTVDKFKTTYSLLYKTEKEVIVDSYRTELQHAGLTIDYRHKDKIAEYMLKNDDVKQMLQEDQEICKENLLKMKELISCTMTQLPGASVRQISQEVLCDMKTCLEELKYDNSVLDNKNHDLTQLIKELEKQVKELQEDNATMKMASNPSTEMNAAILRKLGEMEISMNQMRNLQEENNTDMKREVKIFKEDIQRQITELPATVAKATREAAQNVRQPRKSVEPEPKKDLPKPKMTYNRQGRFG